MNPVDEQRHLDSGPYEGERPGGVGLIQLTAITPRPDELLARCRDVLRAVPSTNTRDWPSTDGWARRLPRWFLAGCLPEQSAEQRADRLQRWRALPPSERSAKFHDDPWSLTDWLHWLRPDERTWFWWDGVVHASDQALVDIEVPGWPAPIGSLHWLLHVAGAETVTTDEPPT